MIITKEIESRISEMEMKMPGWMVGATRLHRTRSYTIRQRFAASPIAYKLFGKLSPGMDGLVLRANEDTVRKIGLNTNGRSSVNTLQEDLTNTGLHPNQALDRVKWSLWTGEERTPPLSRTNVEKEKEDFQ